MNDSIQQTPISLGQQLKNGREALKLSLDDVAVQTNLRKSHLQALENDIFILSNVPPAFVRGYVRNYLRFLRLPEDLVNSANYGEVTLPKESKRVTAAPIPVKNHKSQARWVKALTWLILLSAAGMTLAWWWQEHQKDQASSEQLVSANLDVVQPPQPTPIPPESHSVPVITEVQAVENPIEIAPLSEPAKVEVVKAESVNIEAAAEIKADRVEPVEVKAEPEVTASVPVTVEVSVPEAVNVLKLPQVEVQVTAQPEPEAIIDDELRIEIINANSWITVRGVKNKKLAEKLYNAGEVLTFNGNEQYRLTVGAPANVKIYYKGQIVPLKVDGRVARFKLPLAN